MDYGGRDNRVIELTHDEYIDLLRRASAQAEIDQRKFLKEKWTLFRTS